MTKSISCEATNLQRDLRSRARLLVVEAISHGWDFLVRLCEESAAGDVFFRRLLHTLGLVTRKKEICQSAGSVSTAGLCTTGYHRRALGAEIGIRRVRFVLGTINRVGSAASAGIRVARAVIIHR